MLQLNVSSPGPTNQVSASYFLPWRFAHRSPSFPRIVSPSVGKSISQWPRASLPLIPAARLFKSRRLTRLSASAVLVSPLLLLPGSAGVCACETNGCFKNWKPPSSLVVNPACQSVIFLPLQLPTWRGAALSNMKWVTVSTGHCSRLKLYFAWKETGADRRYRTPSLESEV